VIFIRNKCNFRYLQITRWFIKISLVDTTEMREVQWHGGWAGDGSKMWESPARCGRLGRSGIPSPISPWYDWSHQWHHRP